ncbi:MAG: DUF5011 domain-containing protein [Mariprofundaceae bacterium]
MFVRLLSVFTILCLSLLPVSGIASAAGWQWANPEKTSNQINDVVWDSVNAEYVAVTNHGGQLTSPDGLTWTWTKVRGEEFDTTDIVFDGSATSSVSNDHRFPRVNGQLTPPDRSTYTFTSSLGTDGAGMLLSGGRSGNTATMSHVPNAGTAADVIPATAASGSEIVAMASDGNNNWIALSNPYYCGSLTAKYSVLISADNGASWSAQYSTILEGCANDIVYHPAGTGVWVAVGDNGFVHTSTDNGANWSAQSGIGANGTSVYAVESDGTILLALRRGGDVLQSSDGINWVASGTTLGSVNLYYNAARSEWLSVGDSIYISSDGSNWTEQKTSLTNSHLYGVAHHAGTWITVGDSIYRSSDAINWQDLGISGNFKLVANNGQGQWLAVESLGHYFRSDDGVNWLEETGMQGLASGSIRDLTYDGSNWIAISSLGGIVRSVDGVNWRLVYSFSGSLSSVACDSAGGCVVVAGSSLLTSSDGGLNWSEQGGFNFGSTGRAAYSPVPAWWNATSSSFNSAAWVVTDVKGVITYSVDLNTWVDLSGGYNAIDNGYFGTGSITSLEWAGGTLLATASTGTVLMSLGLRDGVYSAAVPSDAPLLASAYDGSGMTVMVGNNGSILYMDDRRNIPPTDITITSSTAVPSSDTAIQNFLNGVTQIATGNTGTLPNDAPTSFPVDTRTTVTFNQDIGLAPWAETISYTADVLIVQAGFSDITAPVITLQGNATEQAHVGWNYHDSGATASDGIDGDLTASISTSIVDASSNGVSSVDTSTAGLTFTIRYDVSDSAGNLATRVTRSVTIIEGVRPVINLQGAASVSVVVGSTYNDAGATADDTVDGSLTGSITSQIYDSAGNAVNSVDTTATGLFTITYDVSDSEGNSALQVVREVDVVANDTQAPVITRVGFASDSAYELITYNDPGATALDDVDGNLSSSIVATIKDASGATVSVIDTSAANATFTITYSVSDAVGNAANTVSRSVDVAPTAGPVITLNGSAIALLVGDVYSELGATAWDNEDGDVSGNLVATIKQAGSVVTTLNTSTVGVYTTVTYQVTDSQGNSASAMRSVSIVNSDTTVPEISLLGVATLSLVSGSTYSDAGVTAWDRMDGDLTNQVLTIITNGSGSEVGSVDVNAPDTYTYAYSVSDAAGNSSQVVRRVQIVGSDTEAPVITLLGNALQTYTPMNTYNDAGAEAVDAVDGDISQNIAVEYRDAGGNVVPASTVNHTLGHYTIAYNVSDSAGNAATEVVRSLDVSDFGSPTITVPATLFLPSTPGGIAAVDASIQAFLTDVSATDATDGIIATINHDAPNHFDIGVTHITFDVVNTAGNTAFASAKVIIYRAYPGSGMVSTGSREGVVLHEDGAVWSWGTNPARVLMTSGEPLSGITAVANSGHALALKFDGSMLAWGSNTYGELGDGQGGAGVSSSEPVRVQISNVIAVAAGDGFSLALKDDGTLWAWGRNDLGQLGIGNTVDQIYPVQIVDGSGSAISGITAIAAGSFHALALKSDGSMLAWGQNISGQLGDGTTTNRSNPVPVVDAAASAITGITGIAAGMYHSVVLLSDGTVWSWGSNGSYQLGDGTFTDRLNPVQLLDASSVGITGVVAVAAGDMHSLARMGDDTLWTWGQNNFGQLGDASTTDRSSPVQVVDAAAANLASIVSMDGGTTFSLALTSTGGLLSWGRNNNGQLGDGTATDRSAAVDVVDTTGTAFSLQFDGDLPPTLTLIGGSSVDVAQNGNYNDAGADASDPEDGDISAYINVDNPVDTTTTGAYTVTYTVTDSVGNDAVAISRTVNVVQTNAPVITRTGNDPVGVAVGTLYNDAGATASDAEEGDVSANIVVDNPVDVNTVGSYTVTYNVTDASSAVATEVTRTVNVSTAPEITLAGNASIQRASTVTYNDAGATASDAEDGNISADLVVTDGVDINTVGTYSVTYEVTDSAGIAANPVSRTVEIIADNTAPVITINVDPVTYRAGAPGFTPPIPTVVDDLDPAPQVNSVITDAGSNVVSMATLTNAATGSSFTITYTATDGTGNFNTATATLDVVAGPVVVLNGSTPDVLAIPASGVDVYTDPGATATDSSGNGLTVTLEVRDPSNQVAGGGTLPNSGTAGTWTITYIASDGVDLGSATRDVVVRTTPSITLTGGGIQVGVSTSSSFADPGYNSQDAAGALLTAVLSYSNPSGTSVAAFDASVLGDWTVTYTVTDALGLTASATRTVSVVNGSAVITLTGNNPDSMTYDAVGTAYMDPGASAADGNGPLTVSHKVFNPSGTEVLDMMGTGPGQITSDITGDWLIQYSATATGITTTAERIVSVLDQTAPVVSAAQSALNHKVGSTFTDPGASANDDVDGTLTPSVEITDANSVVVSAGHIFNAVAGDTFTLTYSATDSANNTGTATTSVTVVEAEAPVISISGDITAMEVVSGNAFVDPGSVVTDNVDTGLTATLRYIDRTGASTFADQAAFDAEVQGAGGSGQYRVDYDVTDAAGNVAITKSIAVDIILADNTGPVITLLGSDPATIVQGNTYTDAGATATDLVDGFINSAGITVDATAVNTNTIAAYTVTFNVSDVATNAATQVTRTVNVISSDTAKPVISLVGSADDVAAHQGTYSDPGASALDNVDGTIALAGLTVTIFNSGGTQVGSVDTATVGATFATKYNFTDAAGNAAVEVVRNITVTDQTAPALTLLGNDPVTVAHDGSYSDAGATAADTVDGSLTGSVWVRYYDNGVRVVSIDTSSVTSYTVTYDVSDGAGNAAQQLTRTVNVTDQTGPVITLSGSNPANVVVGTAYSDAGATANDAVDGNVTGIAALIFDSAGMQVSTVNTATEGASFTITYNVSDAAGNAAAEVKRIVNVVPATTTVRITLTKNANTTSEYVLPFFFEGTGLAKASDLIIRVGSGMGSGSVSVQKWDVNLQQRVSQSANNDFSLTVGDVYFISVTGDTTFDLTGTLPATQVFSLVNNAGTTSENMIFLFTGMKSTYGITDSTSLMDAVRAKMSGGVGNVSLQKWDAGLQQRVSASANNSFIINENEGYFISVSESVNYP